MHADAALIDQIVARVLRELGTAGGRAPSPPASPIPAKAPVEPRLVAIEAAVVTQELLEKTIGTETRVRILPRAILTPSARDFVRHRGLTVIRQAQAVAAKPVAAWHVLITKAVPQIQQTLDALQTAGIPYERHLLGQTAEAATQATSLLCRGEAAGVIALTDEPELLACLTNRNERVRAAVLRDVGGLDRMQRSLKPNLLAIDPVNRSSFELRQLLKAVMSPR